LNPERWAQIEELFHRAAECDPKKRASLLDEVCNGDEALRQAVMALLAGEENAHNDLRAAVHSGLDAVTFPLVGETVSHYRILDGLGGGGMGLVYRAEDVKLGRQVALKFLLEESAKDPAALGRFEREARSASALEHPNICPIYEFGEHESQPFLVMQLLEGQTLKELIAARDHEKPPLEVPNLLDLALQIATGLEAAHSQGIIHRDIKPANIFVTTQGQAKILDFGLAKLTRSGFSDEEVEQARPVAATSNQSAQDSSPGATPDPLLSRTGAAMGTAGYMSPEQARGEKLDARTDVFSFGLVLYEMATGQRAFKGDTGPMLQEAILKLIPTPVRSIRPELPAKLEKIISKALEKHRDARYQSAGDLSADLKSLQDDTISGRRRARTRVITVASATVLLAVTALSVLFITSPAPTPRGRQTVQVTQFGRVEGNARIVTDGAWLYFVARKGGRHSLAQVPVGGGEPTAITTPLRNPTLFDISPDHSELLAGDVVAGFDEQPLWILPTSGAAPHRLGELAASEAVWSPDGRRIAYVRDSNLYVADLHEGRPENILEVTPDAQWPVWSPDGRVLRFTRTDPLTDMNSIWEVSAEGANLHRMLAGWGAAPTQWGDGESRGKWTPDGKYYVFSAAREGKTSMWAIREKSDFLHRSSRVPVLLYASDLASVSLKPSADGKRVYFVGFKDARELARYDSSLKQFIPYLSGISTRDISFSRDGQWVAYVSFPGGVLWRSRVDGSERRELTSRALEGGAPQWSPDGKQIAFAARIPGKATGIFLVSSEGGTPEAVIGGETYNAVHAVWSPDGNSLLIARDSPATNGQSAQVGIYQFDLKTRQQSLFPGSVGLWELARSPDGRYLAALNFDYRTIMLFDSHSGHWTVLAKGTWLFGLAWSSDNKWVYSQDVSGNSEQPIFRVRISDGKIEHIATSAQIFRADVKGFNFLGLAPDGSPLAALGRGTGDIYALDVDFP
jgi:serine/threonine protein kinase/WD40 repeat protein